jgi:N-acetylglucosaminyldiphosphoundecaprenol N-acetyl-beta-D-mannosaminyltransferase
MSIPKKELLGIQISKVDLPELLDKIESLVQRKEPALVNNVNVHACNLAFEQPAFRAILNRSEVVFCDGFGVKLGAALCGIRLGQRMTPPDWIDDLFVRCVAHGYSVYFVGDTAPVVAHFAQEVQRRYPELNIAGKHHGFFPLQGAENEQLLAAIRAADADIILTGMGMPRQEFWAEEARIHLEKGVLIATGALFRWYTGHERRAPKWITAFGLEWLARLLTSPRRHFRRYVIGLPLFFLRVLRFRTQAPK